MNWIEYSKEEPKEEPNRELWVRYSDKTYGVERSDAVKFWPDEITHWAEIEPPWEPPRTEPTEFDRQMAKLPRTKEEMGPYLLKLGAIWKKEAEEAEMRRKEGNERP